MSQESIDTLTTVLEHARSERDAALHAMQLAERAAAAAQEQASQLQAYRVEYHQRWTGRFRQAGSVELLQCYQGFSGRLDQAISLQTDSVKHAQARLDRARALLLTRETRVAAVGKLIERRQNELRLATDRREQRQTDETAARISAARNTTPLG